jgi:hypothetical protein
MMSERRYPVREETRRVLMSDGVRLHVDILRPDTDGLFPAILNYTPYRRSMTKGGGIKAYLRPAAERGYVTITFDVRGTGNSEGWNESMNSAAERRDGYEMIEWAAKQAWCNGNVGMWGHSYGGAVALQMAGAAPPSLKAVIVRSGSDDPYTEWTNRGGSPAPELYAYYATHMTASNFSPPNPEMVGESWAEMWEERLEKNVPWGIPLVQNMLDGPFWRERAVRERYDQVQAAVFVIGGWADFFPSSLLRTFSNLKGPKRALIGPWGHQLPDVGIPGPRVDWLEDAFRWFDHWLKEIDNGIMDEPPLTLFVGAYSEPATIQVEVPGSFRHETEWPIARTEETSFFFRPDGAMIEDAPAKSESGARDLLVYDPRVGVAGGRHGNSWGRPLDQRIDEIRSLVYSSRPLDHDVEVTGNPRAVLYISSTARVTLFVVKLCDVAPDGTSALVTKGYLNVAHRDSRTPPSEIEPGQVYEIEVDLLACAHCFQAGHRIRIDVASADVLNLWPTPEPCINAVLRSPSHPSMVVLPIVPARDPPLPDPDLQPSPHPLPRRDEMHAPSFSITADVINSTLTYAFETMRPWAPRRVNRGSVTVSAEQPSHAIARGDTRRGYTYEGRDILVDAHCVTSSDEKAFHHTVQLEITVDGRPYAAKTWAVSVPRKFV